MMSKSSSGPLFACVAINLLMALVLVASASPLDNISLTRITADELMQKLQDDTLEPDLVFRFMDQCSEKRDLTLNGVGALELLALDNVSALSCGHDVVLARLATCRTVNETGGFGSVRNYCSDRLAKLTSECAKLDKRQGKKGFRLKPTDLDHLRNFISSTGYTLKQFFHVRSV